MANAQRDQNFIAIGMGVSSADSSTPLPLLVDATTGRLLIDVTLVADYVEVANSAPAKRDQNNVTVQMGVTDDASTNPIPLHVDSSTSYLTVDITT